MLAPVVVRDPDLALSPKAANSGWHRHGTPAADVHRGNGALVPDLPEAG